MLFYDSEFLREYFDGCCQTSIGLLWLTPLDLPDKGVKPQNNFCEKYVERNPRSSKIFVERLS